MKHHTTIHRRLRAVINRIGYVLVAAMLAALSLLLPFQSALAEEEDGTTAVLVVFVQPTEQTTDDNSGAEETASEPEPEPDAADSDVEIAAATEEPVISEEPDQPTGEVSTEDVADDTTTEDAAETTAPTDEETQPATETGATKQSEAEQSDTASAPESTEATGALIVSNEYIFYSSDADYAAEICGQNGGTLLRWSDGLGVMYCTTTPDGGDVVFYPQEIYVVESIPYYEQQGDSISQIGATQSLVSNAGSGVVIAVIDSGIDLDHPALADSILDAVSVIPSSAYGDDGYFSDSYEGAQDYAGHGSHIAGIIAGQTDSMTIGVAPEAQILSIKALEKYGTSAAGTTEWLIRAIQYAISQHVDIINLSIGGSGSYVSAAQIVLQQAADAGILVVCATGNTSDAATAGTIDYPAAYDSTLAVSSVTVDGEEVTLSGFSKYGEGTDLSAPGVAIYSCNQNGGYVSLSGTSMSCAVVAGVAALLLSQDQSLTPQQLIQLMEQSAYDAGDTGYDTQFGWGVVDARAALLRLRHSGSHPSTDTWTDLDGDITQPAPLGPEALAADDWLTTQQGDTVQENASSVPDEQNSNDNTPKNAVLPWILASLGGVLCLGGAGWFIGTRVRQRNH